MVKSVIMPSCLRVSEKPLEAATEFPRMWLLRLSEKSLGTPNWALMNPWKGAKRPFLGPRVGKNYARGVTLTSFQTVSLGTSVNKGKVGESGPLSPAPTYTLPQQERHQEGNDDDRNPDCTPPRPRARRHSLTLCRQRVPPLRH